MLELPDTHPDYDLSLEVLASIPLYPNAVPLWLLEEDFGRHGILMLAGLMADGWPIGFTKKPPCWPSMISLVAPRDDDPASNTVFGPEAFIHNDMAECSAEECIQLAQDYWNKVHTNGF